MKIKVTARCESGDMIMVPAKDAKQAEAQADKLRHDPNVLGARVVATAQGKAIINHVARYRPGTYNVPDPVADSLIKRGVAKKVG